MTTQKFIRISNHTRSFPLILSLPEIKYSVIIKKWTQYASLRR
uniref:Uncharacterized protein n=1 Tax=Klebsiella pneumoniae TaxID=573 RepID=A0A8B0ST01_KLEPN|nr:hypothetical protein [Klebsiella pneumoniae]